MMIKNIISLSTAMSNSMLPTFDMENLICPIERNLKNNEW